MRQSESLLRTLVERGGSDLHLVAGSPPRIRLNGDLVQLDTQPLTAAELDAVVAEILPAGAREVFEREDGVDFAHAVEGLARFRVSLVRQLNGLAVVFRAIPDRTLSVEELEMPPVIGHLAMQRSGLILVAGKTGSGKSTTLAAMIDAINRNRRGHILTIEDPIEFLHERRRCLISQRQVGLHTPGFAEALHSALREDPDVILVGEMRDLETISLAVTAAETGILVLGTLHTNGAAAAMDRIINAFPAMKQSQIRSMLSTSLRGVISQQLARRADGRGRVAAVEVLVNTPAVSHLIREGRTDQLLGTMQAGALVGMQTRDTALRRLLDAGVITGAEAHRQALDKAEFEAVRRRGAPAP
ncbi:type IV pilus twitching motility protein PilT [Ectothiorhodospira mobilis]|uniref:type IV pilus twitching motility protein PilT n=1 Tax=Ectothiorhodospira mobilis TaxID=195064 RepID=UPI001EE9009F|nr:PilT/PilU family type 4a pilus ATPase [Ectothiorhodospira mobilis]MCG5534594.1 PilT/PilU family type 4a pilus ATPase [Ectothiorhodospira mobilis]